MSDINTTSRLFTSGLFRRSLFLLFLGLESDESSLLGDGCRRLSFTIVKGKKDLFCEKRFNSEIYYFRLCVKRTERACRGIMLLGKIPTEPNESPNPFFRRFP